MTGRPLTNQRVEHAESEAASYASSPGVRSRMQKQRTRDTAPELRVRRILHSMGLRYRVERAPLAGLRRRADIVFASARVAVFIDGCFWHGCPEHSSGKTKANPEYWSGKIAKNRERDADTDARLAESGWTVIRVWEHQSAEEVAVIVAAAARRPRVRGPQRPKSSMPLRQAPL